MRCDYGRYQCAPPSRGREELGAPLLRLVAAQRCHDNRGHKLLAREVCQSSRRSPDRNSGARQRCLILCPLCGSRLLSVLSRQCVARLQLLRLRPRCEPERAVAAAASVLCGAAGQNASGALARQIWKLSMRRDATCGFARAAAPTFLSGQIFATALQNTDQRLLVSRRWSAPSE